MKYEINPAGDRLTVSIDEEEVAELKEKIEEHEFPDSDDFMYDVFEPLVCNSELTWISPEYTGDITDAPMLGILGEPQPGKEGDGRHCGVWDDANGVTQAWYEPVLKRWAFMDYQVRSPIQDLVKHGKVVFVGGSLV